MKILILAILLFVSGISESKSSRYDKKMDKFLEKAWNEMMSLSPESAAYNGDEDQAGKLTPVTPQFYQKNKEKMQDLFNELQSIKRSKLSRDHKISFDIFQDHFLLSMESIKAVEPKARSKEKQ